MRAVASPSDQVPSVETVGVGMVLKPSFGSDTFLALVVHSLVPGSSAEQSRMIRVCVLRDAVCHVFVPHNSLVVNELIDSASMF